MALCGLATGGALIVATRGRLAYREDSAETLPTVEQLIAQLDDAGIRRATLLSTAYWFASELLPKADGDEYANVRAENDWTGRQAARFPDRLVAFCSVNPLRAYAVDEIGGCAKQPALKGVKLHLGNSSVDVMNREHVERLRAVFRAANDAAMPIVAHLWTGESYGRTHAEVFLKEILPAASDVTVQIAHFAGGGPGYTDAALGVYADAIAAGNPTTKRLSFDIAGVANFQPPQILTRFAARIRQVGLTRVLGGTDVGAPKQNWTIFRTTVPLTEAELTAIAENVADYLR